MSENKAVKEYCFMLLKFSWYKNKSVLQLSDIKCNPTKKIAIGDYKQKEMRKEFKYFTTKKKPKHKRRQ